MNLLVIFGLASFGFAHAATTPEIAVTEQNASSFYRDFKRLTQKPHQVAPLTAALCALPTRVSEEREKLAAGIHYKASVHLYANLIAAKTIAVGNQGAMFSIGAVIVKEKLADDGRVSGVGGMIKRAAGYDAANGDWEYFYYGGPGEFSAGRISSCIECHRSAKAKDHVYRVWNLPRQ